MRSESPSPAFVPPQASAPIAPGRLLPLRRADFEAMLARLFHKAVGGASPEEIHAGLCSVLAELLHLPLVLLSRALDGGSVMVESASRQNSLWLELQRVPERSDGGVTSRGPAGVALASGEPCWQDVQDEGFALWRSAALASHVSHVLAVPIPGPDRRLLELGFDGEFRDGARAGSMSIAELAAQVSLVLEDLAQLARTTLLARALEDSGAGAFITDLDGAIVWSNAAFTTLSGYDSREVAGRKPSVLRSGHQGLRYYRELWQTIRSGKSWNGETVDRARDGSLYSILQTVSPVANGGRVTHYLSLQQDIGRQRRAREGLEAAAHRDPATGLLTHPTFAEEAARALDDALAAEEPATLAIISLRGIHEGKLKLPDAVEAKLLAAIGGRLRAVTPPLAAALGDFEFGLLWCGHEVRNVQPTLEAIRETLQTPVQVAERAFRPEVRASLAQAPEDGATLEALIQRADRKLADEPLAPARRIPATH